MCRYTRRVSRSGRESKAEFYLYDIGVGHRDCHDCCKRIGGCGGGQNPVVGLGRVPGRDTTPPRAVRPERPVVGAGDGAAELIENNPRRRRVVDAGDFHSLHTGQGGRLVVQVLEVDKEAEAAAEGVLVGPRRISGREVYGCRVTVTV